MTFDTSYMRTPFHWNIHWFLLHPLNAFWFWFSLLEIMKFWRRTLPFNSSIRSRAAEQKNFSDFLILYVPHTTHSSGRKAKTCLPIFNWADLIKTHISSQCENGGNCNWGDGNYFVSLITHEIFISHHIKILANCKNITNARTIVSKIPFLLALAFCERWQQ